MTCFEPKASFIKWFCSISLIWPLYRFFEQVHLIFTKYLWGEKLFSIIWNNLAKYYFDIISRFGPMTSFVTSFALISLILPIHRLFEQLNIILMKCLFWLKLCNVISRAFWTKTFLVFYLMTSFVTSFCYISFNFNLIFTKWLSWK